MDLQVSSTLGIVGKDSSALVNESCLTEAQLHTVGGASSTRRVATKRSVNSLIVIGACRPEVASDGSDTVIQTIRVRGSQTRTGGIEDGIVFSSSHFVQRNRVEGFIDQFDIVQDFVWQRHLCIKGIDLEPSDERLATRGVNLSIIVDPGVFTSTVFVDTTIITQCIAPKTATRPIGSTGRD